MSGIVSLLDPASERAVRALWAELDERHGLREAVRRVPHPHCSYHVAEDYAIGRLADILRSVAAQTQPFAATITGLGAFEQPEPVLYLAVERNAALDALHAALWRELAQTDIAREAMAIYAPQTWVPHITLAQRDLTLEMLRAIQVQWAGRDLRREVWISDLTLLYRAVDGSTHTPLLRFSLGSAAGERHN
jgi:2'-5' RNA ligase